MQSHSYGSGLFDGDPEESSYLLILLPLKDKVAGSSVTGLQATVTRTRTLQTEPTGRAVDGRGRLMGVTRECRVVVGSRANTVRLHLIMSDGRSWRLEEITQD